MDSRRYVFDALYGAIHFPDYVWKTSVCPELQRLREVRLCNINSLSLTGGANINRFEHSLGTAYLASRCAETWPNRISRTARRQFILAALLHDIGSGAFGHSVQYILGSQGFEHEALSDIVNASDRHGTEFDYQFTRTEPIYFGMPKRLPSLLSPQEFHTISELVAGKGPFGPLINGTVDLDNIDNVYRLAFHIGLVLPGKAPLELAQSLAVHNGDLIIDENEVGRLHEWYEVRKSLYHFLLLNIDEFSAKCMLQEALELAQQRSAVSFSWHDVDYQLLHKLSQVSDDVASVVARLMIGDLYGCVGLYSTARVELHETLESRKGRRDLEIALQERVRNIGSALRDALIAIHVIRDVNKTQRRVSVTTSSGRMHVVGRPTRQLLIGVFLKNVRFSVTMLKVEALDRSGVRDLVRTGLCEILNDPGIEELTPYAEVRSRPSSRAD